MGLFSKKESIDQLESKEERLIIEERVATKEQEIAEREATIQELKRKYGSNWRNILGLKGRVSLSTLQSFLGGMHKGLERMGRATTNPRLDPRPGMRR